MTFLVGCKGKALTPQRQLSREARNNKPKESKTQFCATHAEWRTPREARKEIATAGAVRATDGEDLLSCRTCFKVDRVGLSVTFQR